MCVQDSVNSKKGLENIKRQKVESSRKWKLEKLEKPWTHLDKDVLDDFTVVSGANNVNEPPILEAGGYPAGLPLSESTKVGTEVFALKGHDPEGSPVKYGIQLTDHFVVNPRTGVITLAKPLNRETQPNSRILINEKGEQGKNIDRLGHFRHVPIVALSPDFPTNSGPGSEFQRTRTATKRKEPAFSAQIKD
ncbi:Cadherin-87A [Habropoda laboriosa]|uniref:Cadherin-87A n=1 Tax=Habropoda laboriosa TaxID=597456 RepID=A0A0L7QP37_9HYME|nr:Cadherin-87A [Habropoda laboriosa]